MDAMAAKLQTITDITNMWDPSIHIKRKHSYGKVFTSNYRREQSESLLY